MKRKTTEEERKLFQTHIAEAILKPQTGAKSKSRQKSRKAKTGGNWMAIPRKSLRRGQLAPGARIDLHGMTEAAAHRALRSFLAARPGRRRAGWRW